MSSSETSSAPVDSRASGERADPTKANRRAAVLSAALAGAMLGLAFAAVPLYDWFCRVTGFGGTPLTADSAPAEASEQTIQVRFDANTAEGMPWRFEAVEAVVEIRIGETGLAFYRATNVSDEPITGSASFNVAPLTIGGYFVKIDCFCFQEQTLQPGETVEMPVTYYVDPAILDDPELAGTRVITLSYTFWRQERQASAPRSEEEG